MAWSSFSFPVVKQLDQLVIDGVLGSLSESQVRLVNMSVTLESGPSLSLPAERIPDSEPLKAVLAAKGTVIRSLSVRGAFRGRNIVLNLNRDPSQPTDSVNIQLDELNHLSEDPTMIAEVNHFIQRSKQNLAALDTRGGLGKILGDDTRLFYERREAELQRIETLGHSMLEQLSERIAASRIQLEEEYRTRRTQMEGEYQASYDRLHKEVEERAKSLEEREKALQGRISEVDDRDARHVRRQIRKDQKQELADKSKEFKLTPGTVALRQPVATVCKVLLWFFGIGATVLAGINGYLALAGSNVSTAVWIALGIKQIALTTGLVSTAVFYIRWNNRWFEQHATEEFRLKRLSLDLDRASWLVETAMEWKEEKGTELPNILVERLSSGLFEPDERKETPLHPADQLASALLGSSAEANLEFPGGSKLRLDRKGLRELQKESSRS